MQDTFARARTRKYQTIIFLVCKIPLLARRTQPVGQARRATIGHLVYNYFSINETIIYKESLNRGPREDYPARGYNSVWLCADKSAGMRVIEE